MSNNSPWRVPQSPPKNQDRNPFLRVSRIASMANLQESWGNSQERPATSATSWTSSTYATSTAPPPSEPDIDESRTPTPKNHVGPPYAFPENPSSPTSPTNPWARILAAKRISPPTSPVSTISSDSRSPDSVSRSDTPIAPQPLRPYIAVGPEVLPRDDSPLVAPFAPFSPGTQQFASNNPFFEDGDKLAVQQISPQLIHSEYRRALQLIQRQTWSALYKKSVYQWILQHPRTALLLWMADDIQAWPKALFNSLEDNQLPFTIEKLEGVAQNPQEVVELQWHVAIKQLPREGRHTEFATHETVPLQPAGELRSSVTQSTTNRTSKRIDCVKWCDNSTTEVYVRKRLDVKAKPDKDAILARIREYHRLSHPNIAKIVASYARGQTVAFLTFRTECNLTDYLACFAGRSEADQLLSWINDLSSALSFIHNAGLSHRSIRPHKILVDPLNRRISFAPFGIATPARSAGAILFTPFSADPAYIYAAPESISPARRDTSSPSQSLLNNSSSSTSAAPADVWSLGCVFLEMATAARGTEIEKLESYRSSETHDPSYHANRSRVRAWAELMRSPSQNGGGSARARTERRERSAQAIAGVLVAVQSMLADTPVERPSMGQVCAYLDARRAKGPGGRRRGMEDGREGNRDSGSGRLDLDVDVAGELELVRGSELGMGGRGVWGDLESLNGYYTH